MNINKRTFLSIVIRLTALVAVLPLISWNENDNLLTSDNRIDKIELYRYDVNTVRHFSFGTWYNRQHVFLKITSGKYIGWSEVLATTNTPDLNPMGWGAYLKEFKGMEINEAYNLLKKYQVKGSKLSIYPNPATERFKVKLTDETIFKVSILKNCGKLMKSQVDDELTVSDIDAGVYFVHIETDRRNFVQKFMVQK